MKLRKELLKLQQENYNYKTRLNKLVEFKPKNQGVKNEKPDLHQPIAGPHHGLLHRRQQTDHEP